MCFGLILGLFLIFVFWVDCFLFLCFRFCVYTFILNQWKSQVIVSQQSSLYFNMYQSLIFLGVFSFSFFPSPQWLHSQDPHHPLLTINLSDITKLSSINYLTWSLQIQSLLEGYDLHHFIDGAHTPPPPTVTITSVASPNPAYTT